MTQPSEARAADDAPAAAPARWKRVLRFALGLGLFLTACALAVRTVSAHQDVWDGLKLADAPAIVGILVSLALINIMNGTVLRDLVAHFGVRLPVRAWLGITMVSTMLNLVSPMGGASAVRGVYLKRSHGVPLTTFASMLAVSTSFSLAASGALAAGALLALGVPGGSSGVIALACSIALVLAVVLALAFMPPIAPRPSGIMARLAKLSGGWRSMSDDRGLVASLATRNTVNALLHAVAFVLAFRMAGFEGSWLVPVTSSAFARIGALIAITPAGLGIFEAFGAVSAGIVGASPAAALLGVLLVRVFGVAVALVGGGICSPFIVRTDDTAAP